MTATTNRPSFDLSQPGFRSSFFWMVVIALALRLGVIVIGHTYNFKTADDNFSFGWEMGRIGRSLAEGQGFGNPFEGTTGPTAWEAPLYPFLIAGVFRTFGIYSHASALVLLAVNSVFSSLTCIPIFLIARRCFGWKVATWSAWLWALLPSVLYWCTRWVWETSLATLLLTLIFWRALVFEEKDGMARWLEFGLLWGVAALTNPSLLSFLPISTLWIWYCRGKRGKASVAGIFLSAGIVLLCIAPWTLRNYRVLGRFIPIRSNFGAELRLGNGSGANGLWLDYLHPSKNSHQLQLYRESGEIAYVAARKHEALAYIRADWTRFFVLSFKRFVYFWDGLPATSDSPAFGDLKNAIFLVSSVLAFCGLALALRKRRPAAGLFLGLILAYPAVYYVTFPHPRYRHPIEPELGVLMVYAIAEAMADRDKSPRAAPS